MKKITTIIIALALCFGAYAQSMSASDPEKVIPFADPFILYENLNSILSKYLICYVDYARVDFLLPLSE